MSRADNVKNGIQDGLLEWFQQHEISGPNCIVEGIKDGFRYWLERHTKEIIDAIASACAKAKYDEEEE